MFVKMFKSFFLISKFFYKRFSNLFLFMFVIVHGILRISFRAYCFKIKSLKKKSADRFPKSQGEGRASKQRVRGRDGEIIWVSILGASVETKMEAQICF